jgi:hypothetical protein
MREKFFQEGHYKLRLDDIKPKQAKPHNRIHLNCSMLLLEEDLRYAPTKIRRVWEIVSNPELDTVKIAITSKLAGMDVEIFPTPPTSKSVPLLISLTNTILRDIEVHRRLKGEIRLYFSIGMAWDTAVWKWGGKQFSMDCFAKFSQSQTELFDDNPADQAIQPSEERERLRGVEVDSLARELGTNAPVSLESPAIDPLRAEGAFDSSKRPKSKAKKLRTLAFRNARGKADARPNA